MHSSQSQAHITSPIVPSELFVFRGGANDFFVADSVATADIGSIVATLQADGAQHNLVHGIPDLGLTPLQGPGRNPLL